MNKIKTISNVCTFQLSDCPTPSPASCRRPRGTAGGASPPSPRTQGSKGPSTRQFHGSPSSHPCSIQTHHLPELLGKEVPRPAGSVSVSSLRSMMSSTFFLPPDSH